MQSLILLTLSLGVLAVVASWLVAYLLIANDKFATPRRALSSKNDASFSQNDARELATQSR